VRDVADAGERIDGPGVDIAGLGAHDHRAGEAAQLVAQSVRSHPPLVVNADGDQSGGAKPEEPECPFDGVVTLGSHERVHRGRASQAVGLDIPAGGAQYEMACRRQRGEVSHLAAGNEPYGRTGRQTEQRLEPAAGHLLHHGRARCGRIQCRVLVPGRGEPVSGNCRRGGAADDEAVIPAAVRSHQSRLDRRGQSRDDGLRIGGLLGQRPIQRCAQVPGAGTNADATVRDAGQVARCLLVGLPERAGPVCLPHNALSMLPAPLTVLRDLDIKGQVTRASRVGCHRPVNRIRRDRGWRSCPGCLPPAKEGGVADLL
jgi:hypothetical protein